MWSFTPLIIDRRVMKQSVFAFSEEKILPILKSNLKDTSGMKAYQLPAYTGTVYLRWRLSVE